MSGTARKTEIEPIDGTPEKRMFWSIISDYDLKTGLCELVDNALDLWVCSRRKTLKIEIILDVDRQIISVSDNAGGVKLEDLRLLVSPGGSRNDPSAQVIGIFGVGSKRAGVALGEQMEIRTRFRKEQSYQLDITKDWLETPDWELPAYEIPSIAVGTTSVDIFRLRKRFTEQDVEGMCAHLGEIYSWFIERGCTIKVNGAVIGEITFDAWAYPPGFSPRSAVFDAQFGLDGKVSVSVTAGLICDRIPQAENYGVYFYCNNRLIVKELRDREVGYFVSSEAGVPHPDASLCRAIVQLQGPAQLMPWNSSKSGINYGHAAFQQIRPTLIQLVSYFSSLSRRTKDDWDRKVFRHTSGEVEEIEPADIEGPKRIVLPRLPRVRKSQVEHLKSRNKKRIHDMPWTLGLVEALGAVDIITRQRLDTKNRIALILLDSNFEIAMKEFVVHRNDIFPISQYNDATIKKLFQNRPNVIKEILQKVTIPPELIAKTQHYYNLRNKLIHERATVGVTDSDVQNYRSTIEEILTILFDLKFAAP